MKSFEISVSKDHDLIEFLEEVMSSEKFTGYILGVVGNLAQAVIQCPQQKESALVEGPLEIISLNGHISPKGAHLHICISDKNCQVWGGHLLSGAKVLKQVDILMGIKEESDITFNKRSDDNVYDDIKIEVAIVPGCPWSQKAIRILRSLSIPFVIKEINDDNKFKQIVNKSGVTIFPQIFIDNKLIGGYSELIELNDSGKLESFRR